MNFNKPYFDGIKLLCFFIGCEIFTSVFELYPSARGVYLACAFILYRNWESYKIETRIRSKYDYPVTPQSIEMILHEWKTMRPDDSHVAVNNIYKIKREQDTVCVGHLQWLMEKLLGYVPLEEDPPVIVPSTTEQFDHVVHYGD